jgi:hypothetical protein
MFTIHYKGFPVVCETALEVVAFITVVETPIKEAKTTTRPTTSKPRKTKTKRTTPSRAEKNKRNAKARAAYLEKHPSKTHITTTTSRLEALPSKPTSIGPGRGKGSRARTSQAVMDTLKRSPSPLTLDEIDTDLEKSGWPYKGRDRKGAIRATLARLKANGTVSAGNRVSELGTIQLFRLERTNGEVTTPVEQAFTREERAEVQDSEAEAAAAEAAAESDPGPQRDYL